MSKLSLSLPHRAEFDSGLKESERSQRQTGWERKIFILSPHSRAHLPKLISLKKRFSLKYVNVWTQRLLSG